MVALLCNSAISWPSAAGEAARAGCKVSAAMPYAGTKERGLFPCSLSCDVLAHPRLQQPVLAGRTRTLAGHPPDPRYIAVSPQSSTHMVIGCFPDMQFSACLSLPSRPKLSWEPQKPQREPHESHKRGAGDVLGSQLSSASSFEEQKRQRHYLTVLPYLSNTTEPCERDHSLSVPLLPLKE